MFCLFGSNPSAAQIFPDTTLPVNSTVTPQGNIRLISGGTQAGGNLFHSFREFSVPSDGTAFFNNAPDIQNIISRVTGGSISNIDGIIRANGSANVFLINPNGIIFGANASLEIGGSFVAGTASSLKFANGTEFSATAPGASPLLTVSVPIGLQFGSTAGSVVNQSQASPNQAVNSVSLPVGLQVPSGKTLALVGGNVTLESGNLTAPGGRVELGSVAPTGLVSLTPIKKGYALGYAGIQNFQDIQFSGGASVDASGEGGDIQVQGRNVTLTGGAQVFSSTLGAEAGGTLALAASEAVELSGDNTQLSTFSLGTGSAGNLTIATRKLTVAGGAVIATPTFGPGQAGDLTVRAEDSVELVGRTADGVNPSGLGASVDVGATGNGGNLIIETGRLLIRNGAQVNTSTFGAGQAGDVRVRASDSIELIGRSLDDRSPSGLFAQVEPGARGNAGNLSIQTGRLTILGGAQVSTAARTGGQGGTLTINASDSILVSGTSPTATLTGGSSGLFVSAEPGATRDAGDLNITTGVLTVQNGARISADNFGTGQGGTATLNVRQLIIQDGGQVRAGSLLGNDTSNNQRGAGGTLTVNATESVEVSGTGTIGSNTVNSTLFTQAQATGDAGNLNIRTGSLNVLDGGDVTVSSTGLGKAGQLTVQARSIELNNNGALRATTLSGTGGNISLQAQDLVLLRRNSQISTTAGTRETGGGTGGSITIDTDNLVALENSDIDANAFGGPGGQVRINALAIFGTERREQQTPESDITASSDLGPQFSGIVEINRLDVDPSFALVTLPAQLVDVSGLIAQGCAAGDGETGSKFTVTGRGGLPPSPYDPLNNDTVWEDAQLPITTANQQRRAKRMPQGASHPHTAKPQSYPPGVPIVPATGWVFNNKGEITLTALAPSATPQIPRLTPVSCHAP